MKSILLVLLTVSIAFADSHWADSIITANEERKVQAEKERKESIIFWSVLSGVALVSFVTYDVFIVRPKTKERKLQWEARGKEQKRKTEEHRRMEIDRQNRLRAIREKEYQDRKWAEEKAHQERVKAEQKTYDSLTTLATKLAIKKGYKGMSLDGISAFVYDVIENGKDVNEGKRWVYLLSNQDAQFVAIQNLDRFALYTLRYTSIFEEPAGGYAPDITIMLKKPKRKTIIAGQSLGVLGYNYVVFTGVRNYTTALGVSNQAWVFEPVF